MERRVSLSSRHRKEYLKINEFCSILKQLTLKLNEILMKQEELSNTSSKKEKDRIDSNLNLQLDENKLNDIISRSTIGKNEILLKIERFSLEIEQTILILNFSFDYSSEELAYIIENKKLLDQKIIKNFMKTKALFLLEDTDKNLTFKNQKFERMLEFHFSEVVKKFDNRFWSIERYKKNPENFFGGFISKLKIYRYIDSLLKMLMNGGKNSQVFFYNHQQVSFFFFLSNFKIDIKIIFG